ncbi:hypothetical protein R3P38DRAFT_2994763 [Favolaschia claudopus]|uniref:SAP domain-containing protein n=1 Tax=Favolaschia claudopus TaxID=2862362 RepID=A0AAW0ASD5_9AGAR
MSSPATNASLSLSTRPLPQKLVAELKDIAEAMSLPTNLKKADLLRSIQKHMSENPQLSEEARFLPLFGHRTAQSSGLKTSAHKSAEDEAEDGQDDVPTGANKELLRQKFKTDPKAQHRKLGAAAASKSALALVKGNDEEDGASLSDNEDVMSVDNPVTEPEGEVVEKVVEKQVRCSVDVQVNFLDENNRGTTISQVFTYSTKLSSLIPAALKNDSPIKNRGGRLYRSNIHGDAPHHHVGTIAALADGGWSTSTHVDEYALRYSKGLYQCDVFWDAPPEASAEGEKIGEINIGSKGSKEHLKFTGSGRSTLPRIAPKAILCIKKRPQVTHSLAEVRTAFAKFVHGAISEKVEDLPAFKVEWERCTFAGQLLDRHLRHVAIFSFLREEKWKRGKGWAVPLGREYEGIQFDRKFLLEEVLNIKQSRTFEIDGYFAPEVIKLSPQIKAWVESKGVQNSAEYQRMKSVTFVDELKDRVQRAELKKKEKEKEVNTSRGRRRRRRSSSPPRRVRRSKKSRSESASNQSDDEDAHSDKRKRLNSEDLDDDDHVSR